MLVKRKFYRTGFRSSKQTAGGKSGEYVRACYGIYLFGFIPIYLSFGAWQKT